MKRYTLSKSERLCSERRIDALFSDGRRGSVGPLRFCWVATATAAAGSAEEADTAVSVLFSVPKKAFKRAWKRNLIKRRMRESYRLNKSDLVAHLAAEGRHIDLALICSVPPAAKNAPAPSPSIPDYKSISDAVSEILCQISARC